MRDLYPGATGAGLIYACLYSCIFLLRVCRLPSRQGRLLPVAAGRLGCYVCHRCRFLRVSCRNPAPVSLAESRAVNSLASYPTIRCLQEVDSWILRACSKRSLMWYTPLTEWVFREVCPRTSLLAHRRP